MSHLLHRCFSALLLTVLLSGLTACRSQPQPLANDLLKTRWQLVSFSDKTMAAGQPSVYFTLAETAQRISGFSGCNRFSGSYQRSDEQLRFSELFSTRMACHHTQIPESEIFKLFEQTRYYQLTADKLVLIDKNHQPLARFIAD